MVSEHLSVVSQGLKARGDEVLHPVPASLTLGSRSNPPWPPSTTTPRVGEPAMSFEYALRPERPQRSEACPTTPFQESLIIKPPVIAVG